MLYGGNRTSTTGYGYNQRTPEPLDEPTQKLFKAIDDENLEAFKQALEEGADVNAFDEEGMTPLMSIANSYVASGDGQAALEKMAKLLIQKRIININAQSEQPVYEEEQKKDQFGRLVYLFRGEEVVKMGSSRYIYCSNGQPVNNVNDQGIPIYFNDTYDAVKKSVRTSLIQKDTALHIACQTGAIGIVKILLTHPGIKTDVRNREDKDPKDCIARGFEDTIKLEFEKAQKANELLGALSNRDFYQANMLLNEELNPNCWTRMRHGEISTPLSSIIILCPEKITENGKEVLIKLLKHKELDLNQIKSTPAMIERKQLKQIIEQAIKERLIDAINSKNLDDVKKLVEDNCFMNRAIVTAAFESIERIRNYLNEKFPASVKQPLANTRNAPPETNDEFIARELQRLKNLEGELERTKAQLTETEQELANKTSKISQLERDLRQVKQEKLSQQTKINDLSSELIQCKRIVSERASDTVEILQLKRDLKQVKQEKLSQQTKINDLSSEVMRLRRIIYGGANDTVEILQLKRDLKQVREERDRLSSEIRTKSLSNKNKKSSQAISPGKKQSNYASAFFILSGACAGCACLAVLYNYPVIGACLTAVALVLLLVGCYLCKADERDIRPGGTTNNPQVTRVFTSSPNSAENFCTC